MRLLKIGRDSACNIVLHSEKVSSLHAEMTILNNGDILLEDKNSRNGTFLMNQPIKPGVAISVRRGDAIRFGDVELMWSQVPMPENNSNFKALFGIGTNFRNEIQISGNTVSRFHATLKNGKDGKSYLQDHSKNGTTINGTKIVSGQNVRVKRSDAVVCGGVPVDLSRFIKPNDDWWKKAMKMVAAAAIIVGIVFGIKHIIDGGTPSIKSLQNATVCVHGEFFIEASFEDNPFENVFSKMPKTWRFGIAKDGSGKLILANMEGDNVTPIPYSATAFFISENGELGTNRHVALPWEYLTKEILDDVRNQMANVIDDGDGVPIFNIPLERSDEETFMKEAEVLKDEDLLRAYLLRFNRSSVKISGVRTFLGVALSGTNIGSIADFKACQMIAESGDVEKDVALLRLNTPETPKQIVENGFFDISRARCEESSLIPQEETLMTIGYPGGFNLGFFTANGTTLQPTVTKVSISKKPDNNNFQIQGMTIGGASGSPIIDEDHRLVGVLFGGFGGTDVTYGCNIKHLVELFNKHKLVD